MTHPKGRASKLPSSIIRKDSYYAKDVRCCLENKENLNFAPTQFAYNGLLRTLKPISRFGKTLILLTVIGPTKSIGQQFKK